MANIIRDNNTIINIVIIMVRCELYRQLAYTFSLVTRTVFVFFFSRKFEGSRRKEVVVTLLTTRCLVMLLNYEATEKHGAGDGIIGLRPSNKYHEEVNRGATR